MKSQFFSSHALAALTLLNTCTSSALPGALPDSAASTVGSASSTFSLSKKAGLSGYVGIGSKAGFKSLQPYISWYSDYSPTTPSIGNVKGIPMLWGDGVSCNTATNTVDKDRLAAFDSLKTAPEIIFGLYEPDWTCPDSSQVSVANATKLWNNKLAPLAINNGTVLGSPSMATQASETWLANFSTTALKANWTYTSVHINKNNIAGIQKDVEHYKKYGKKIWVSEFACVNDVNGFQPCTDQTLINEFLKNATSYFESNDDIVAYGPSNGNGLGKVWPLFNSSTGELTATGRTYLSLIGGS
ncbi:MAG: hypothetical protein M1820_005375 [Bogoriella megaspora]|nr:MAG: hypothetical protein M1820_005375 [Bogoriella megaspora]